MRLMSFALTERQILDQTKTVTRRHGWLYLKAGDRLQPIRKGMGLKKGESIERIGGSIRVLSVTREPLCRLTDDIDYGLSEVAKEGFSHHPAVMGSPHAFVSFYMNAQSARTRPSVTDEVTRIEFAYEWRASDGE